MIITKMLNIQAEVTGNSKSIVAERRKTQVIKALLLPILSAIKPTTIFPTGIVPFEIDNIIAAIEGEIPLSIAKGTICTIMVIQQKPEQNMIRARSQNLVV
jgi:hypothetical protein